MIRPRVADQAERDRLVTDLHRTLFVEAGAGTGKTTAVVSRIVARVAAGLLTMDRLAAITFTIAAAGDLRVRIREGLDEAARSARPGVGRAHLSRAASEVDRARIETIHAFCSALLRMHPLEAGLPPDLTILADISAESDVRERFRLWFDGLVPTAGAGLAVRRGLLLGVNPGRLLDMFIALDDSWDVVARSGWVGGRMPAAADAHDLGRRVQECIDLLPHCHTPDELHTGIDSLRVVAHRLRTAADGDAALAALVELPAVSRTMRGAVRNWNRVDGVNACSVIKATMRAVLEERNDLVRAAGTAVLGAIAREMRSVILDHAEERRRRGLVSYHDLLVRARNLVRDDPDVRVTLRARWDAIAVDEFQDTDPLQAELAFLLGAAVEAPDLPWAQLALHPGRLCIVGDPKQSIYRFRRADIGLYSDVERRVVEADPGARLRLSVNFRSGRRIIDSVNHVFGGDGGLMTPADGRPGVQATYVDLVPHAPEIEGTVRIVGGPVETRATAMWRQEARATAATVQRILAERWPVGHGTPRGPRPCRADDICILMPSRTNLRNLERELETARIPYRLESGSLIVATQEVRDLLNILRAIDDPTDEVALVAALRSPAYGCSDVELVRWRATGGRWSYRHRGSGEEPRVAAALDDLGELHGLRHRLSVPGLIDTVLSRRLLRASAFDDWRPRETWRRQRFVADQARALARSGRPTLHEAVDHLERLARHPTYDSVADDEPGDERCVRVMTVHAAKGLEFPALVLTGLGRRVQNRAPMTAVDHTGNRIELCVNAQCATAGWEALAARERDLEDAERVRLLYVALTRARDHLVVSVFRAAGGEDTEAARLDRRLRGLPGVEVIDVAEPAPGVPPSPVTAPAGGVTGDADGGMTPEEHRGAEAAWVARRTELLATLGSLRLQSATGLAHAGEAVEVGAEVAASRRGRAATSLGRAVHAVLQVIDLATAAGADDLARAHAAAEGIPERAAEVARLVRTACASEPVRRAAGLRHWREVPLGAEVEGIILEGFVDLLYELPDGRLVIVDHKTDAVQGAAIDARLERHRLQGGAYALLVERVTGRAVARVELVFAAAAVTRTVADPRAAVADVWAGLRRAGAGAGA